uniref:Uncharacterized protein n=1 Tax=Arundo donax TaxID=35708 RepID=A0A0A9DTL6_ARUDO
MQNLVPTFTGVSASTLAQPSATCLHERRADLAWRKVSAPEPTRTRERFTKNPRSTSALSLVSAASEVKAAADIGREAPWRAAS